MKYTANDLDIFIPVHNRADYTEAILEDIANQTVMPNAVFICDNASTDRTLQVLMAMKARDRIPLRISQFVKNRGVNSSWNWGVRWSNRPLLAIFNNDIAISSFFFEMVIDAFNQDEKIGIVLPKTVGTRQEAREAIRPPQNFLFYNYGGLHPYSPQVQGWCWVVKRELLVDHPIPTGLWNFYGDLFWFKKIEEQGHCRAIMQEVPAHHITDGISFHSLHNEKLKAEAEKDHQEWRRLEGLERT